MAKIKYDVKDVDPGYDRSKVKPGLYPAKLIEVTERESRAGNQMLEVVLELTGPNKDVKGAKLWHYVVTDDEAVAFRLREFTDALGLKPTGTLDTDKIVGEKVQVRVRGGKDLSDEYRPEVAKLIPADASGDEDDEGDEPEEGEEEPEEETPYEEMSLSDLKEEAESREIEVEGRVTSKKLIAALEADDEEDGDEEPEEPEEEPEPEGDEVDLDELSRAELKKYIKDEELEVKVFKSMDDDDIRAAIIAAEEEAEGEEPEEEEGEEPEAVDYDSWGIQALKDELEKRKLKSTGKKSILVSRLEKDDESGDDPF